MKPSCFKRMLAVFMAVIMICTLLPGTALAASTAGTVHVTIENTTFTTSDAPWTGTLLDAEVALTGEMSMMSAVTTALNNADYEYTSNGDYISGINGLSEKQNGALSGWMGTLNDWFVNTGFSNYKESDHTLCDGDVIRVMYTSTGMGTDIGSGSYGNTDTALSALSVTGGTLEPSFAPAVTEYTVTVPSGTTEVNVNATAKFKDHQIYLSVGETAYRRTAAIPVADGTTITVRSGEPSIATTYTLKVQTSGGSTGEAGYTDWTSLTSFTEGSTYYIGSAEDLLVFATLVNSGKTGEGCSFQLTSDVSLSSICNESIGNWTPIGNSEESPFKGTFDGKDYTIKELYINSSDHAALFAYTDSAILKNIVLLGEIKTVTNKHAAGLVYKATNTIIQYCTNHVNVLSGRWVSGITVTCSGTCTITNCANNGIITSTATNGQAAGILAATSASSDTLNVTNCENNGEITGIVAAGITGSQVRSGNVEKCTNTGAITSTKSGATGISDSSVNVRDCTNTGTITCVKAAAGIIGIAKKGYEITGCVNKGEIITTSAANGYTAGIVGKMKGTMSKCVNLGSIKGSYYVGGLAGVISGDSNISHSYNRGSIVEGIGITGSVGGLIGSADSNLTMICCYNTGDINTPNLPNVGGLVGNFSKKGTVVITDCYHSGTITGNDAVGGLIGKINHASASLTLQNCYSAASSVAATDGVAGMAFGSITAASALNTSNLFVRQISGLKVAGADTLDMDINAVIPLTHAQMTDASFVTHLGTAFAKFSTDIYNGGEYSADDWATYTEYYGDYPYPILVSTCGASPLGERCNVQFLGAQYAKVTVNGSETYATTVTPGSQVNFTIETGDPEITVTSVAVGDTTLEATDGTYSCTVSADTIVTITLSGTMTAPGDDGGDTPEKTGYPISFTVSDGTNPIGDAQITVTGAGDTSFTPEEGSFWLDEGSYTVSAVKEGYHSVTGTLAVTSDMSREETNTLSFNLYPTSVSQRTITMNIVAADTLDTMMVYNGDLMLEQKEAADSVSFTLPAGSYTYAATRADSGYGSGPFTIADADGQSLTLRAMDMTTYGLSNSSNVGYTVTMKAADGTEYFPGSLDAKNGGGARGWFLLPASDYGEEYHYTFNPVSDYYWGSYGVTYLYSGYVGTALRDFNGISGSQSDTGKFVIAPKGTATFTVPTGADFQICHRVKFYEPLEILTPSSTSESGGMTTYTYDIPTGLTLHYELEMPGYVKKAATFTGAVNQTITVDELTPASAAATDIEATIDSAVLTNAPSSHYIELNAGERFDLYLHRNWQASNSITGNYYVDPTYHIEVISGDSVTVTDNYYAGATLNAVSNGVSIIRITYDALDFVNTSGKSYIYSKLYEENTTVLVVNVGGNGVDTIDSGCGASEFEIQYFIRSINDTVKAEVDQYAELTFTPSANVVSVELHAPVGSTGAWTDSWTALEKKDNSFTAHLKEGSNVLRFKTVDGTTSYHVIRAIGLDMTATGDSLTVKLEKGQFLLEANTNDDLSFQFQGLQMPLPKLAALINPGLESVQNGSGWDLVESTYAAYTLRGSKTEPTTITGKSSQYEISTKNAITLNFATPDTYTLTEGALHTTSFGAGSYTGMTKGGYTGTQPSYRGGNNTSLDTRQNLYSAMPELTIRITSAEDQAAAKAVEALIDAIGEVTLESKDAIEAAEEAYDALTEEQKALVSNHQKLEDARTAYDKLVEDAQKPVYPDIPVVPDKPSSPSKPSTPAVPEAPSFTDISGHWAADAIEYAVANDLMNGVGNGRFAPNEHTTRGMIVTILARLEGVDTSKGATWYEAGQQWAMKLGISDGTNMDGQITREQLATMLYRYAQLKGYDTSASADLSSFKDASSVSEWAQEAMQWAVGVGLIQGSDNQLTPTASATRAQVATILQRFCESILK